MFTQRQYRKITGTSMERISLLKTLIEYDVMKPPEH